jgi:hypothetical protein
MAAMSSSAVRRRVPLVIALALTVAAGLGVRAALSGLWAKYAGVALWATAAYWAVLLVRPALGVAWAAGITLAISWAVELAQLTPVPAYLSSKHILLRLLLGASFGAWDLPAYLVGVALGAALHRLGRRRLLGEG